MKIRIDTERLLEMIGGQLTTGEQRLVKIVTEAANSCIVQDTPAYAIFDKDGNKVNRYGTGSWNAMKRVLPIAMAEYPDAGLHTEEVRLG